MNFKARFKPRAEAGLLSKLVQEAWQDYQDRIANVERQAEVAERLAQYFEQVIPAADLEVLSRYKCIAWHDRCNVRVYDAETQDVAKYREAFGVELPRKVPAVGTGGFGYPSIAACEPEWGNSPLRELDAYFAGLLKARKQYQEEYKQSTAWPTDRRNETGQYPTWEEIGNQFPVLGNFLLRNTEAA